MATGRFAQVPTLALTVIDLLEQGSSIAAVQRRLRATGQRDVDVAGFVRTLVDLGFVTAVDGRPLPEQRLPRSSFTRVRPEHVRWLLHPATTWCAVGLWVAAAVLLVARPSLLPGPGALIWHESGGLVLLGDVVVTWLVIYVHELAHLFTARAAGAPGRITLSTRLQFLAAQTDVSGVWAEPRRVRLTVYLAGVAVNVTLASSGVLVRAFTDPHAVASRGAGLIALISLLLVVPQLGFFMRTDGYFVLQDLLRCPNLYGKAIGQLRRIVRRGENEPISDRRERTVVRVYTLFLVAGTVGCIAVAAFVTYPAVLALLVRAVGALSDVHGNKPDAIVTIVVLTTLQATWLALWWRRLRRRRGNRREVRGHGHHRGSPA